MNSKNPELESHSSAKFSKGPKDIIYFAFYIFLGLFVFYRYKDSDLLNFFKNENPKILSTIFGIAMGSLFIGITTILLFYRFMPSFFIHLACWLNIASLFIVAIWTAATSILMAMVFAVIGCVCLYKYLRTPVYVFASCSKILKGSASLLLYNIISISGMELLNIMMIIPPALALHFDFIRFDLEHISKNNVEFKDFFSMAPAILFFFWSLFLGIYILRMFCSSLMVSQVRTKGSPSNSFAFFNTLRSIGSLCFASLLIAIVETMSYLVRIYEEEKEEKKRREGNKGVNIIMVIIFFVLKLLLAIIASIVEKFNSLIIPYIACTNCSFKQALAESSQIYIQHVDMVNSLGLIQMAAYSLIFLFFFVNGFILSHLKGVQFIGSVTTTSLALPFLLSLIMFLHILSCIYSVSVAGLYLYIIEPDKFFYGSIEMFNGYNGLNANN